jgi:hypothetical protein
MSIVVRIWLWPRNSMTTRVDVLAQQQSRGRVPPRRADGRAARAAARQAAWAAGACPDLGEELRIGRRVAAFVVLRTSMLEAQHRASTLS